MSIKQLAKDFLDRAYEIGSDRGSSLNLDYFLNPVGDIFIKNPNDSGGIIIFADGDGSEFFSEMPDDDDFCPFDMYKARNRNQ